MLGQRRRKLGLIAAAGVLSLSLAAAPAQAHHGSDIVVPIIAGIAIGSLWHSSHNDHYYRHSYRYKRHGHYRGGHSRGGHYRHSYSREGHYRKGHGHNRHHYKHHRRHSSSHGGYYGSKRRH